jgi:hypothetical protein
MMPCSRSLRARSTSSGTSSSCSVIPAMTPSSLSWRDVDGDKRSPDVKAGWATTDVALFEPLVRATGRDEDALARVASLVGELRDLPNGADLVPDGFDELWDVVWQVHLERLS